MQKIPWLGRSPRGGQGNPLQYSCLGNPMEGEIGGLQTMGSQRIGRDLATEHTCENKRSTLLANVKYTTLHYYSHHAEHRAPEITHF